MAENQAISIRAGLQDWEVDADDVVLGQRIALGGYAEVFIGKYEVRAAAVSMVGWGRALHALLPPPGSPLQRDLCLWPRHQA